MMPRGQKQCRINKRLSHISIARNYHFIESKLKILDDASRTSIHLASSNHNVDISNIIRWKKQESRL